MDRRLALMCGTDIPVPECQLVVKQPRISEIAYIGEQDFFIGAQTFCINKNKIAIEDESSLENINNFQIFMTVMGDQSTADKKYAVEQIMPLFFPDYKVSFSPRAIVFMNKDNQPVMVDEQKFTELQETISDICCLKTSPSAKEGFNPQSAKAKEIAEKLMRGRQRVAAEKGENGNASVLATYLSSLTIGVNSMSLLDLTQLTLYQLFDLIERYSLYINWDLDIRTRLAGGKPDSHPDNWMKNIH